MIALRRAAVVLALLLGPGAHPVAAQVVSEEACSGAKEQIRYLVNEGAFIQDASVKNEVNLLANAILLRNEACGTPGDESFAPSTATKPPPTPVQPPTAVFANPTPIA